MTTDSFVAWVEHEFGGSRPENLTSLVRQVAINRGVSERTMWRWIKKLRSDDLRPYIRCLECGVRLPDRRTLRRRYCDEHSTSTARSRRRRRRRSLVSARS